MSLINPNEPPYKGNHRKVRFLSTDLRTGEDFIDYEFDRDAVGQVEDDATVIDEFSLDPFTYPTREVHERCKELERKIQSSNQ